jgi:hypothetical protein
MTTWLLIGVVAIMGAVGVREVWVHLDNDNVPAICHDIH